MNEALSEYGRWRREFASVNLMELSEKSSEHKLDHWIAELQESAERNKWEYILICNFLIIKKYVIYYINLKNERIALTECSLAIKKLAYEEYVKRIIQIKKAIGKL